MRKLIIVALACATFGGAVGALATAAVQSQASPAAIAAAMQRVTDRNAEQNLKGINTKLATLNQTLLGNFNGTAFTGLLYTMESDLFRICENTGSLGVSCAGP